MLVKGLRVLYSIPNWWKGKYQYSQLIYIRIRSGSLNNKIFSIKFILFINFKTNILFKENVRIDKDILWFGTYAEQKGRGTGLLLR